MEQEPIDDLIASGQKFPIVITSMPASKQDRRLALGLIAIIWLFFAIAAPFADIQLGRVDAFIPVIQTVMCLVDLITAALLLAQYSIVPRRAVLVIACGYVLSGLFAFLQTLAFPAAYSPSGLIGDGVNTASWLFVLWHASFSLSVTVYALLNATDETVTVSRTSTAVTIATALTCTLAATAALTWLVTGGTHYLPTVYVGMVQQTRFAHGINIFLWLLSLVAFAALLTRARTVLDNWLIVILVASWPNFLVAIFLSAVRFTLGWYAARFFLLVASSTLLVVLLAETILLYARLANTTLLLLRERRDRRISLKAATGAIAHEIRQPLTVLTASADAALIFLRRKPPALKDVSECLNSIVDASHHVEEIITSIRGLLNRTSGGRQEMVQLNDIIRDTLSLMRHDLEAHEISVTTEYSNDLPQIQADPTQIEQVVFNLARNAIEAMRSSASGKKFLRVVTSHNANAYVAFYIQDTGSGISAADRESIFNPFFTTKPTGSGLGLFICRTIIEDHGGTLRLAQTDIRGSMFEIAFPAAPATDNRT
jgi:signal transduction histidine kinase